MTGKLADTVMSVRNGEQIARKYQPVVYNPSTDAQIAQRAKLKLISQLSAVLAPAIAIRRMGSVSSRNLFTKKNFGLASYASDTAQIKLPAVQLTNSVVAIGQVTAQASEGSIALSIAATDAPYNLDKVVYVICVKEADNRLRFSQSIVVSNPGTYTNFPTTLPDPSKPLVIYAYGIRLNSETARVAFGNLTAPTAESVAKLLVSSTLTETDVTLTETSGVEYPAQSSRGGNDEDEKKSRKK